MASAKTKELIQRIVLGSMIFALVGFGLVRWLRLEFSSTRRPEITYDSDLRDRIPNQKPLTVNRDGNRIISDVKDVTYYLSRADDSIQNKDDTGAFEFLSKAERQSFTFASDKSDLTRAAYFQDLGDEIRSIKGILNSGKPDYADFQLKETLKRLAQNR